MAPWYELTVLPRVGEATARSIVAYRQRWAAEDTAGAGSSAERASTDPAIPVFCTAADLAKVRGIGPRTVERTARYLYFDQR